MLDKVESERLLVGEGAADSDESQDSQYAANQGTTEKPRHRRMDSILSTISSKSIFSTDEEEQIEGTRRSNKRRVPPKWQLVLAAVCGAIIATTCLLALLRDHSQRGYLSRELAHATQVFSRPAFPVVAMVFFGRRKNIEILDCYLRRNLVSNGGYLDRVEFIVHTDNKEDLAYLEELLPTEPLYIQSNITAPHLWGWNLAWQEFADPETLYMKIDDDVLFIDDNTIPELVRTAEARPDAYGIGANAVNEFDMLFQGYHHGAILPFLPELLNATTRADENTTATSWRPSEMPMYRGNVLDKYDLDAAPPNTTTHRWLPLENNPANLQKTPAAQAHYNPGTIDLSGWTKWALAAQQHYSLLSHLETRGDALSVYHFGDEEGIWNTQYNRYSINFLAIRGKDIQAVKIDGDDEERITVDIPKQLGRPFLVQTRAVVAHFSYGLQFAGMNRTDVRQRYRAYANEMICGKDHQIEIVY